MIEFLDEMLDERLEQNLTKWFKTGVRRIIKIDSRFI